MTKEQQERKEYTEEEKALFIVNNTKVNFWVEKAIVKDFDKLAKEKGMTRKEAIIKFMQNFVSKNKK